MRRCIFTLCVGDKFARIGEVTIPLMQEYATKLGADLEVVRNTDHKYPHYSKIDTLNQLLGQYDQVLYLDLDLIVNPRARDVFQYNCQIGMVDESPLGYDAKFEEYVVSKGGMETWAPYNRKCYNTGVILANREFQGVLQIPSDYDNHYFEQSYINYSIMKAGVPILELPRSFNRMTYFDMIENTHHLEADFTHYAGNLESVGIDGFVNLLSLEVETVRKGRPYAKNFRII